MSPARHKGIHGSVSRLVLSSAALSNENRSRLSKGHFDAGRGRLARSILTGVDQIQAALVDVEEVIYLA